MGLIDGDEVERMQKDDTPLNLEDFVRVPNLGRRISSFNAASGGLSDFSAP